LAAPSSAGLNLRAAAIGLLASFSLNLIWENAQAFLFRGYEGFAAHFWVCFIATFGDVVITAAIYGVVALVSVETNWFRRMTLGQVIFAMLLGIAIAAAIELRALASGRWAYDGMPLIPFTGIGLVPLLQMMILPPLSFLIMRLGEPGPPAK